MIKDVCLSVCAGKTGVLSFLWMLDMAKALTILKVVQYTYIYSPIIYLSLSTIGLSKWVKQRIQHERDFRQSMASLKMFVDRMQRGEMDVTMNAS